jgi:hypothetical protein
MGPKAEPSGDPSNSHADVDRSQRHAMGGYRMNDKQQREWVATAGIVLFFIAIFVLNILPIHYKRTTVFGIGGLIAVWLAVMGIGYLWRNSRPGRKITPALRCYRGRSAEGP